MHTTTETLMRTPKFALNNQSYIVVADTNNYSIIEHPSHSLQAHTHARFPRARSQWPRFR